MAVEVAGRHVLFSGCARDGGGEPARQATIALARALHMDLWEAPDAGCCGARADRRVGEDERARTLAPIYDAAGSHAMDVVCLSPACRRVVSGFAPDSSDGKRPRPLRVFDVVTVLTESYGLGRLVENALTGLTGLRVALHSACHANHNAVVREEFVSGGVMARGLANVTSVLSGSRSIPQVLRERGAVIRVDKPADPAAPKAMANLLTAVGATSMQDVSLEGHCAEIPLFSSLRERVMGRAKAPPCLTLAAEAEADVLATPCFLCFLGLNGQQRFLPRAHPGREVPVLYVAQLMGLACEIAANRLGLSSTAVSARRALRTYVV
jgi:heterodisulfide reductase subunit B